MNSFANILKRYSDCPLLGDRQSRHENAFLGSDWPHDIQSSKPKRPTYIQQPFNNVRQCRYKILLQRCQIYISINRNVSKWLYEEMIVLLIRSSSRAEPLTSKHHNGGKFCKVNTCKKLNLKIFLTLM